MPSRVYRVFKTVPFHDGGSEEFSNVYRYSHPGVDNQVPQDVAVATLNAIMELERACHHTNIQFTRGESANVNALDGVQATDVETTWNDLRGLITGPEDEDWTPENVVMCQLRVGKRRWLRKFLHSMALQAEASSQGVKFNWDAAGLGWDATVAYANEVTSLAVTVGGSTEEVILEAGNGTPAEGAMNVDNRIRWHDLKY